MNKAQVKCFCGNQIEFFIHKIDMISTVTNNCKCGIQYSIWTLTKSISNIFYDDFKASQNLAWFCIYYKNEKIYEDNETYRNRSNDFIIDKFKQAINNKEFL